MKTGAESQYIHRHSSIEKPRQGRDRTKVHQHKPHRANNAEQSTEMTALQIWPMQSARADIPRCAGFGQECGL